MKAITILKRCRAAGGDIERLQERIDRWREVLTGIGAPQADPNGGSRGSGDKDKNGRIYAEIDALEREKAARQERAEAEKVAVRALMDMVPDLEGKILFDYYARGWTTTRIAQAEKYTAGYVRRTKRIAEQLLEMLDPERVTGTLPAWYLREKGGDDK